MKTLLVLVCFVSVFGQASLAEEVNKGRSLCMAPVLSHRNLSDLEESFSRGRENVKFILKAKALCDEVTEGQALCMGSILRDRDLSDLEESFSRGRENVKLILKAKDLCK